MAFNVRIYGHSGVMQVPQVSPHNFASNGPWVLVEPYNWVQLIATNGATAVSSTVVVSDTSQALKIEVPDGQSIRYEINPPQRQGGVVSAGTLSPRTSGVEISNWGVGWTISIVEASFYP